MMRDTTRIAIAVCMAVLLTICPGCKRDRTGDQPQPPDTPQVQPPAPSERESGFSVDLGNRPSFTPQVEPYEVEAGLKNVDNLRLFKEELHSKHMEAISENAFVVVPAQWKQMEFIYEQNNYPREHLPSFVTADSALHFFHIFYDYVLRTIEVGTLYERVCTLAVGVLRGCAERYERETVADVKEAALHNYGYALVPVKLLELPTDQWGVTVPDEATKLADAELALIDAHSGFSPSPTVRFKVDYSQFIPRGHYTRSDKLKRFFKAMMWYGLVPMALRNAQETFAPRLARQAVLMSQVVLNDEIDGEKLIDVWEDVYGPTAFMVGYADDNTPGDYGTAVAKVYGEPLETKKLVPEENLKTLMEEVLAMRPPGIVAASITRDPGMPGIPQFRLMGQRFILDSYIFQMMVFPYVGNTDPADSARPGEFNMRTFPMGLDAMSVLGSERAYQIADTVYQQTKFKNYTAQTQKLREEVNAYTDADWTKNVYAGWLHTLRFLLEVKDEGYPSFMRNEAWMDKQLNASLGSWAELRHDTILYAKQSVVVECGGEGGQDKPPPPPKGYVEPEVLTYWRLGLLTQQLRDGLKSRELLTDEKLLQAFDDLISLLGFLQDVSIKELTGVALTDDEFKQIENYGATLANLNLMNSEVSDGGEITSMTDKDMAVVADVHTGNLGGVDLALEEGVGRANIIYAVYPLDGKLLLGRGAVFDYYEFTVPVAERMTDEQWQEKLSSSDPPKSPEWTKSFRSPIGTEGEEVEYDLTPSFTAGGC